LRHRLRRRLAYTPGQLFDLVADVERYPEFIRWVESLRSYDRRPEGEGIETLNAEARVRFALIRERFATRVRLDRRAFAIHVDLLSGPFRRLECDWRFLAEGEGTCLEFAIDFEFGSRLLERLLAANFDLAVGKLMASFERRARALYIGSV